MLAVDSDHADRRRTSVLAGGKQSPETRRGRPAGGVLPLDLRGSHQVCRRTRLDTVAT